MSPANPTAKAWLALDAAACEAIERGVPADLVGVSCVQIGAAILVASLGRDKAVSHLNAVLRLAREGDLDPESLATAPPASRA
jgi:hypothetical protein